MLCRRGCAGHDNLQHVVAALLRARAASGAPVVALGAKTTGLCVPPRALRLSAQERRTLRGLLVGLETEGTAAPSPEPPRGLAPNLRLGEYQLETLGWMLAREQSRYGMEDLFESSLGARTVLTSLPAPLERKHWPKDPDECFVLARPHPLCSCFAVPSLPWFSSGALARAGPRAHAHGAQCVLLFCLCLCFCFVCFGV